MTVKAPQRGERSQLVDMAAQNAKEEVERITTESERLSRTLTDLQTLARLPQTPRRMESYDISNLGSDDMVASMVVFVDGKPLKRDYRKFAIKTLTGPDDYAAMQEVLECAPEIKACNQKARYIADLNRRLDEAEQDTIRGELFTGSVVTAAQSFLKLGIATTVLTGVTLMSRGGLALIPFLMFLIAATRVYDPIGSMFANMAAVFACEVRIERMQEIENEKRMTGMTEYDPDGYDIRFEHVTFAYREKEDVLRDVSFTAKQGQVTALVGPSGGGKSTAARLAARFWDPAEGTVRLGGVDVSTVDGEALLKNYAIVFQDVVLFADSVMENIRLGKRDATDEEVLAAAKAAQCDAFVSRLPEGYHTMIGENGSRLSGGERQRISIARAILKDAPVILLDEATASLDVENETAVQAALSGLIKDKTVLIIAHRMRTVMNADQIVLLSGGRVVEMGSPAELLKKNGLFRHMAQLQSESMEWTA